MFRFLFFLIFSLSFFTACTTKDDDPYSSIATEKLYKDAKKNLDSGNYKTSIPMFEKVEARAFSSELSQKAQVNKAFAQYKSNQKKQALATLERFMKIYPTSEDFDYALYLKGLALFDTKENIVIKKLNLRKLGNHDPSSGQLASETFKELIENYPDSKHIKEAKERALVINNALAYHEINVAKFYFERQAYVSSIARIQSFLNNFENFKNSPIYNEALNLLIKSYDKLEMKDLSNETKNKFNLM